MTGIFWGRGDSKRVIFVPEHIWSSMFYFPGSIFPCWFYNAVVLHLRGRTYGTLDKHEAPGTYEASSSRRRKNPSAIFCTWLEATSLQHKMGQRLYLKWSRYPDGSSVDTVFLKKINQSTQKGPRPNAFGTPKPFLKIIPLINVLMFVFNSSWANFITGSTARPSTWGTCLRTLYSEWKEKTTIQNQASCRDSNQGPPAP